MQAASQHTCHFAHPSGGGRYGAIYDCFEDDDGRYWVTNDEYSSQVAYCPECGSKAPTPPDVRD